jgi:hypothetical protein
MSDAKCATNELPIACSLSDEELRRRREALASDVYKNFEQVDELPDGYAFRYPGGEEWAGRLLELITFERECCPFITFELSFEPAQGPLWLRLRGAAGVKEFIREELRMLGARSDSSTHIARSENSVTAVTA